METGGEWSRVSSLPTKIHLLPFVIEPQKHNVGTSRSSISDSLFFQFTICTFKPFSLAADIQWAWCEHNMCLKKRWMNFIKPSWDAEIFPNYFRMNINITMLWVLLQLKFIQPKAVKICRVECLHLQLEPLQCRYHICQKNYATAILGPKNLCKKRVNCDKNEFAKKIA